MVFFLQVEDGKDYLNIYDGGSDDSELVESLTGELESLTGELDYGNLIIKGLEEKPAEGSMLERKTSLKANFTIQIL